MRRRLTKWQPQYTGMLKVDVAIAIADERAACIVLMRAHLCPLSSGNWNLTPDAPELDRYLWVVLPSILPEVEFDEVAERTRRALSLNPLVLSGGGRRMTS